jgi:hypothetical protein
VTPGSQSLFTPTPQSPMMARTSKKGSPTRAGKAKPAKSVPRKSPKVPRKAARPVAKPAKAARKAPKAAKAKPRPAKRAAAKPKHDAAHEQHMAEIRSQVARRRPGMGAANVPHEHQDPSLIAPPGPPVPPVDALHQNWGDAKEKSVTRNDNPTNWYRQAPKPPQKK